MPNSLFASPFDVLRVSVFHDESGNISCDKWFFSGLFWIQNKYVQKLTMALRDARKKEDNYSGEIHFHKLPKMFVGQYGSRARVARRWFLLWRDYFSDKSYFNVLAINKYHPRYDRSRFGKDFHAYNRFTAIALKSGLAWFLKDYESIELTIFSDEKIRRPHGLIGDGVNTDNFESYLLKRIAEDTSDYKGPKVKLSEPIKCISCSKNGTYSPEEELIQFTDLLLGTVVSAVEK